MDVRPAFVFWLVYCSVVPVGMFLRPWPLSLEAVLSYLGWGVLASIVVAPFAFAGALAMLAVGERAGRLIQSLRRDTA